MELKKGIKKIYSSDPYYDLFIGKYIDPSKMLDNKNEIETIYRAMEIIEEFLEIAVEDI